MNAMVTFPDRAGSVSWDLASPGGCYEISRQCSDERAATPAHPPEPRPLPGPGTATGRQCGHDREMETAAGAPGCLQSSPPHSQSPAPRTRAGAGGAAPGVVVGSGRRVAGPASESLPPTQPLGGVSGVGALAVAALGGLAAPGPAGARPLSGLSPGVLAPGCLLPAPPRWAPALSVSRHRPRHPAADGPSLRRAQGGQWGGLLGALPALLSLPRVPPPHRQRARVHAAGLSGPGHDHQRARFYAGLPPGADSAQSHQAPAPLDQRTGRTGREHVQSRNGSSVSLRRRRAIAASDVCLRTLLQRASPVQSHGRPNAASAHAPLVCQTTATGSPGPCAHVHNVVTLDNQPLTMSHLPFTMNNQP